MGQQMKHHIDAHSRAQKYNEILDQIERIRNSLVARIEFKQKQAEGEEFLNKHPRKRG